MVILYFWMGRVAALEELVEPFTRGDPVRPLRWTCKSVRRLSEELKELGHPISPSKVAELLAEIGYSLQSHRKRDEGKGHLDRDAQFGFINDRVSHHAKLAGRRLKRHATKKGTTQNWHEIREYFPTMKTINFKQQREEMVRSQLAERGIRDERVLDAMRSVPREQFVPEAHRDLSYRDGPLPIEQGQTISQPYVVAEMAEALEIKETDRILEVGAGSGYAAAILGYLGAEVHVIEYHRELAESAARRIAELGYDNVEVAWGDGTWGWPSLAPFDAILVSAGGTEVPEALLEQLTVGGRMVIPIGKRSRGQELIRIQKTADNEYEQDSLGWVQFVPLVGGGPMPAEKLRDVEPLR